MPHPLRDTDLDWRLLAETEPYWAMNSDEGFRRAVLDDAALQRFHQSGEETVAHLFGLVRRHLVPDFAPQRALELGCGVGRLLLPIARRAGQAVGVDIAPALLALAEQGARAAGLDNVTLLHGDDGLSRVDGPFQLVNCHHVLQHVPPERGLRLVEAMLARLAHGGVCSLQVSYARSSQALPHEVPKTRYYRRDGQQLVDILPTGWEPPPGTVSMYDYDLHQVAALIQTVAGQPVLALPTADGLHLGMQFIFQRAR